MRTASMWLRVHDRGRGTTRLSVTSTKNSKGVQLTRPKTRLASVACRRGRWVLGIDPAWGQSTFSTKSGSAEGAIRRLGQSARISDVAGVSRVSNVQRQARRGPDGRLVGR